MAFQIPFTDQFGNENPESYWRVMFLAVDLSGTTARAEFLGWKNKAAHDTGKQHISSKSYSIGGADFVSYMTGYAEGNTDLFGMCYDYALAKLEGTAPAEGVEDTRVSFFDGAVVV